MGYLCPTCSSKHWIIDDPNAVVMYWRCLTCGQMVKTPVPVPATTVTMNSYPVPPQLGTVRAVPVDAGLAAYFAATCEEEA